jgi:transcriptional regulator with XRE-family HTH domain
MEPRQERKLTAAESVAAEVRAQLARQKISGRQAAAQLGWTQPYMSRRLTGEIPFNVADLAALAELLGVPAKRFLEGPPRLIALSGVRRPGVCPHDRLETAA